MGAHMWLIGVDETCASFYRSCRNSQLTTISQYLMTLQSHSFIAYAILLRSMQNINNTFHQYHWCLWWQKEYSWMQNFQNLCRPIHTRCRLFKVGTITQSPSTPSTPERNFQPWKAAVRFHPLHIRNIRNMKVAIRTLMCFQHHVAWPFGNSVNWIRWSY